MRKNERVSLVVDRRDKLLLRRLSEELYRTQSGTIRWLIRREATHRGLDKLDEYENEEVRTI